MLALSVVVRVILCMSGGQDYWTDERAWPGRSFRSSVWSPPPRSAACGSHRTRGSDSRLSRSFGAVLIQAAANFWQPLESFPADFIVRNCPDDSVAARYERLIWVNTKHLFPGPEPVTLPAHYVTLAAARHPLAFLPYQYEGYTPERRAVLRSADTRMQLIGVLP